jgi:DNA recombination protein RmuC
MLDNRLLILLVIIFIGLIVFIFWLFTQNKQLKSDLRGRLLNMQEMLKDELVSSREKQFEHLAELQQKLERRFGEMMGQQAEGFLKFNDDTQNSLHKHRLSFEERQEGALKLQQDNLAQGMTEVCKQVTDALSRHGDELGKRVEALTQTTDNRLKDISERVEKRLHEGFNKTTATFADVVKRLTLIDEAQKKITELSGNVVSLQEVLADKRSRGAFGEVQLSALVRNVMPENSFKLQYALPNNTRVDCMLFLPEPSGNIAIDSKFPLETYRRITDLDLGEADRQSAKRQFKQDIRKHIKDIADKYIIQGVTSDGAVMFIPAEAVFAEIHAHYYELVEESAASQSMDRVTHCKSGAKRFCNT